MNLIQTKNGTIIEVFVKPNSANFRVKLENDEIDIHCTEEPERGKVNKELIKALTKIFHSNVELVSGGTSRQKRLLIKNLEKNEVEIILQTLGP